jgi:NADH-quinone oxidoreductase subunit B
MLMVMGTISKKWHLSYVRYTNKCQNQDGLLQLALVLLQEVFSTPTLLQGIDKVIPVDVYVPGCPPRPEQIVDGVMKLQELVRTESVREDSLNTKLLALIISNNKWH